MGQELTRLARLRELERAMRGVVTILMELEQSDVPERLIAEDPRKWAYAICLLGAQASTMPNVLKALQAALEER